MAKPILMAVDDDPDVLRTVERDLRRQYGSRYRILCADSGATALDLLTCELTMVGGRQRARGGQGCVGRWCWVVRRTV